MTIGPNTKVVQHWDDTERNRRYQILKLDATNETSGYCGEILEISGVAHNPCLALSEEYKQPAPARRWLEKAQRSDNPNWPN